jgi:ribonuclease Z
MDLSVFFAGTGGSMPTPRRGLPAVLVHRGGDRILFDCGEGTQRQLVRSVGLADLDDIFITHFHADHWLGLPGLLKTFDLRDRDRPLHLHGPPGLRELWSTLRRALGRTRYELVLSELEPLQAVARDGYAITAFSVCHRARALGYALVEDARPGRFDEAAAVRLGVAPGPDFGRLQRGEAVDGVHPEQVLGPPREGRKVVLSGDTRPCQGTALAAHAAQVLVHEATFTDADRDRARQTGHSTAREAAQLARDAGVDMLALTHVSSRYLPREVRDEARAVDPSAVVPSDFDTIEIPFPERGAPALVRAERERPGARAGAPA